MTTPSATSNQAIIDRQYMSRALQWAARGLNTTSPNPRVGCLIVHHEQIVGEGFHVKAGEGHAEVNALKQAGNLAQGATAYVTLEPCSHYGRTPPCSDGLIEAGIQRVVCAMTDPNPAVSGRGIQKLRDAGIEVVSGVLESEARQLNPGFIKRMEKGLPFVRLKLAMSIDGRTAMQSGESQWITGPAARQDVQRLRARSCAIITGVDSVLMDDSALTVRPEELGDDLPSSAISDIRQPLRVVLDSHARLPERARILSQPGVTLLARRAEAAYGYAAEQMIVPAGVNDQGLDLHNVLQQLSAMQCNEVLVETGATLAGALVAQGLVDELVVYIAPTLLGSEARPLLNLPLQKMAEQIRLRITDTRMVGSDVRLTLIPEQTVSIK